MYMNTFGLKHLKLRKLFDSNFINLFVVKYFSILHPRPQVEETSGFQDMKIKLGQVTSTMYVHIFGAIVNYTLN